MWGLRASIAVLVLSVSAPGSAAPRTIVLLTSTAPALDDRALAEAVTIYTRDLGLTVETQPGAPDDVTGESLGTLIARVRATGARMMFWYRVHREGSQEAVLYAVVSDGTHQTVHALPVAGPPSPALYRLLALKLRAVLTGADEAEPHEPTPEPVLPRAAPMVAPRSSPATISAARAPVAPSPYRPRAEVAVGYVATLPLDSRLDRHGIGVEVDGLLGARWEVHLGVEVSSSPTVTRAAGAATLFDLPIRFGGRVRMHWRRLTLAVGPILSLHFLALSASGNDGVRGAASTVAAGVGGDVVAEVRLTDHLALRLGVRAEDLLPDVHVLLHGIETLEAGGPIFGITAGGAFSLP